MAKTKIDWADYSCNCFWGCRFGCSYCQARNMARRFGRRIGTARGYSAETIDKMITFEPVFLADQLTWLRTIRQPSRIFMSFMGEPFSPEFDQYLPIAFRTMEAFSEHTFLMLTKQPHRLPKWSPFPSNCGIGVSTIGNDSRSGLEDIFAPIQARLKVVSIEPLLDYSPMDFRWVDWVIVGQQTPVRKSTMPRKEWVEDIAKRADHDGAALFLKNNLRSLFGDDDYQHFPWAITPDSKLRQEFPTVK